MIITDYGVGIKDVKKSMQPLYTTLHTQERSGMGFTFMEAFSDEITVKVNRGRDKRKTHKTMGKGKSVERTCELIRQAKEGNKKAQEILVEENTGLIWSVVKRFQGRGYDKEDLFQIGSIGLLKCIDNFDLERKVKFFHICCSVNHGRNQTVFKRRWSCKSK